LNEIKTREKAAKKAADADDRKEKKPRLRALMAAIEIMEREVWQDAER
jgi:hypothetical protein